ncbi:hypothetical protein HPG69_003977 [Diceros bicornis minor]|uniref:Uncharacterized protein n=1 Tax=Diceros bicornis minor TaxID=77932 RepID=A0A7J7EZ07_DICBM|nr:hypothetical protein HPG69_003977 [Diceros bicornis minor]
MEGLLPAIGSIFQPILKHLWGALLVISESLRQVPDLSAFPWEILVCIVVMVLVVLITLRSETALGERCSACGEVNGKCGETIGPVIQAEEALESPGGEASPLRLQTLCMSAINTNLSRLSLQDTVNFLEKARKSQPLKISQGVSDAADLGVPLPSPEEEHPERAGQLGGAKMNEDHLGQIISLQTEEASLQHEISKLESEIQQLKKKLPILPDLRDEDVMQLDRKRFAEERARPELDKELLSVCRDLNSTCQLRDLCKKVAEDMRKEMARRTSYFHKEKLLQVRRVEQSWGAAVLAERKLKELRRENERNRQKLAMFEARFPPLPGGPVAPAAPPAAPRGQEACGIPGVIRPPEEGGGSCHEASETRAPLQV